MNWLTKTLSAGVVLATVVTGCGSNSSNSSSNSSAVTPAPTLTAADLRTKVDLLLGDHLMLAAKTTEAALGQRNAEFNAYSNLLNINGLELGDLIGDAFGSSAKTQFNSLWSAHNGLFVDYTKAVAAHDSAAEQKAVNDLQSQYITPFSKFIADATGLPLNTVTDLVSMHVTTTAAVVNAQGAQNWPLAYTNLRAAYAHMQKIGDPLAEAIATKKSSMFAGDPTRKDTDLRVSLNQLLQEHLYLATMTTDAALGSRAAESSAAQTALNNNGTDLGSAIGDLFGTAAKTQFNTIWSAHNGFFIDYTTAVAKKDDQLKQQAVNNLTTQYVPQFAQFLSGATDLSVDTLKSLITDHVTTTAAVVDAQGAQNWTDAANKDRLAAQHMQHIADPLAAAIVTKLPASFAVSSASPSAAASASASASSASTAATSATIDISLMDYKITPASITLTSKTAVFNVHNNGAAIHNFTIEDMSGKVIANTRNLNPGESQTLSVTFTGQSYKYLCTQPGHASLGMMGTLTIT